METTTGLILAFVALFCWGFGDFFIQRATRLVGSWRALFYIGITGTIGLFPFIAAELPHLTTDNLLLLGLVAAIVLGGALFDFEALRQGKIAIIEPIIGLELPLTVALSMVLAGETLTTAQILLIVLTFIGLTLAISAHKPNFRSRKTMLEKGVILALVGAIAMALNNLVIGISSQNISPLLTIWFGHTGAALACLIYLAARKQLPSIIDGLRRHPGTIIAQSVLDNLAWIAFATATTIISISIVTTISESYIALTVLLGVLINKEKLHYYQIGGASLAIVGILALSAISA
jgi:drug/metabolite transporter (DMT)-like permease